MIARRTGLAAVSAVLAALLTAAAVADPQLGSRGVRSVLAVDRSPSIDASMRAVETRWIDAVAGSSCVDPCRVIAFAGRAQSLAPGASALAASALVPSGAGATNLERGLEAAIAAAPQDGRVVALSDGLQTVGDASRVAAQARARNVTVDAVPLDDEGLRDAALTRLSAPHGPCTRATRSRCSSRCAPRWPHRPASCHHDGGRAASQVLQLRRGDNPYTLSYTATGAGWHSFRVRVALAHDQRPQNDLLASSVDVGPAPRALVVSAGADPPIARILRAHGVRTTTSAPAALPASAGRWASDDAVVLDDVPASSLTSARSRRSRPRCATRDSGC